MHWKSALILSMATLSGCVSNYVIKPVVSEGQELIYQSDAEVLLSKKQSVIFVGPLEKVFPSNVRPKFIVSACNYSQGNINFGTENVSISSNGTPVRVFTYDELAAEIKKAEAWATFAAAMNGASQSMAAQNSAYTYHSGNYNTNYYGSGGSAYGYGTYSGYSYNPGAAMQAQAAANAQTEQRLSSISANARAGIDALNKTILRKSTVLPGMCNGGVVRTAVVPVVKGPNSLSVSVVVGDEIHVFLFAEEKLKPAGSTSRTSTTSGPE